MGHELFVVESDQQNAVKAVHGASSSATRDDVGKQSKVSLNRKRNGIKISASHDRV